MFFGSWRSYFQAVFDASSSKVIHVGDADMGRIFRLGLEVDKLVAKITTRSSSRRYRYRRACMYVSKTTS